MLVFESLDPKGKNKLFADELPIGVLSSRFCRLVGEKLNSDVVIIGGGVIGLTIARSLALKGVRDICLIEKTELGTEASHAAGGILAPQVEADSDDAFFRLACRSRDMYIEFAAALFEETGVNVELDTTGTIYLAFNEAEVANCEYRYSWQRAAGLSVEKLNGSDVLELEARVNRDALSVLLFPRDIQVENRRLISALANSVYKLGVAIQTHTQIQEIHIHADKVVGLKTSTGVVGCNTVVVAAGCWSGAIPIVGSTEHFLEPNLEPVRGQMICLEEPPPLTRHVIYSHRGYIVPRHDGRLLAGSTSEPGTFVKQTTAGGIANILEFAREISPKTSDFPIVDMWAGLRPKAPDGLPVLGPCGEIGGLHYATGHYRNGILLAPITGELMADAILEPGRTNDLAPFSPGRFQQATVTIT